jgi:hypothetical protein
VIRFPAGPDQNHAAEWINQRTLGVQGRLFLPIGTRLSKLLPFKIRYLAKRFRAICDSFARPICKNAPHVHGPSDLYNKVP